MEYRIYVLVRVQVYVEICPTTLRLDGRST